MRAIRRDGMEDHGRHFAGIGERMAGLKEDIGRLEGLIEKLNESFDKSATKQGERIGELETLHAEIRRDFHWSLRLAAAVWALLQGIALVVLRVWLGGPVS